MRSIQLSKFYKMLSSRKGSCKIGSGKSCSTRLLGLKLRNGHCVKDETIKRDAKAAELYCKDLLAKQNQLHSYRLLPPKTLGLDTKLVDVQRKTAVKLKDMVQRR